MRILVDVRDTKDGKKMLAVLDQNERTGRASGRVVNRHTKWLSKSLESLRSSLLLDVFRLRNGRSSSMDDTGENILPRSKRVDDRLDERVGKQTNSNFATEFAIAFKLRFAVPLIL
jgi:hypothetical protein